MDTTDKVIFTLFTLFLVGVGGLLVMGVVLNYQDSHSPDKTATCTVVEKTPISYKGRLSDREVRTKECGKFSAGKRLKVWDALQEGHTYTFTYHGGNSGLRDLTAANEQS